MKWLNDHTGRTAITSDMLADLITMTRHGDLTKITVENYGTTWLVHLTANGWHPGPVPDDPPRNPRFHVIPTRTGREQHYRHLLRCTWTASLSHR